MLTEIGGTQAAGRLNTQIRRGSQHHIPASEQGNRSLSQVNTSKGLRLPCPRSKAEEEREPAMEKSEELPSQTHGVNLLHFL